MKHVKLFEHWLNESSSLTSKEELFRRLDNSGYPFIEMVMYLGGKEYKGTGPWKRPERPLTNLTVEFIGTEYVVGGFTKKHINSWKKTMTLEEFFYNLIRPEWKSVELVYDGDLRTDLHTGGSYVVLKSSTNSPISTVPLPSGSLEKDLSYGREFLLAQNWADGNSRFEEFLKLKGEYDKFIGKKSD